jgi:hypothetical protein
VDEIIKKLIEQTKGENIFVIPDFNINLFGGKRKFVIIRSAILTFDGCEVEIQTYIDEISKNMSEHQSFLFI